MVFADDVDQQHFRAIVITAVTTLLGILAGIGSHAVAFDGTYDADALNAAASDTTALLILAAAIGAQMLFFQYLYDDWGGGRDALYVVFMTFCLWFITWGILLTTGATIL